MKRRALALALVLAALSLPAPAYAMTMPAADLSDGQTLGAGFTGLSYDAAVGRFTLGGSVGDVGLNAPAGRIAPGLRAQVRFLRTPVASAAGLVGVKYDPGNFGGRAYVVPEAGVTVAYRLPTLLEGIRLVIRLGATLTINQGQIGYMFAPMPMASRDPSGLVDGNVSTTPSGNFFQRLAFGPTTGIGVGLGFGGDRYEITAGGGTMVGLRVNF